MPWSGGAFTRAGGSTHWVDDKNASINIVASRHDTNDEDIAAGISNAVTKDGQSKMTANFTPNADASFDLGSVSFRWRDLLCSRTGTFGALVVGPPASGVAADITGISGIYTLQLHGFNGAGNSRGLLVQAGVGSSSDFVSVWQNQAGTTTFAQITGDGSFRRSDVAASPTLYEMGYMDSPQNLQNAAYTLVLADRGKSINISTATPRTWIIPANASVAFPTGTTIMLAGANGAGAVTLQITTDTLIWTPSGTAGTRTLTPPFIATLYKISSGQWLLSGNGIS